MTAAHVLEKARSAGLDITCDGWDLVLEAASTPPPDLIEMLVRYKPALVELLKSCAHWDTHDWRGFFEERAGIAEFDCGYSRSDAELIAFADCVDRWLSANPPQHIQKNVCLHCGRDVDVAQSVPVAVQGNTGSSFVLHAVCATRWRNLRRWRGRTALGWLLKM